MVAVTVKTEATSLERSCGRPITGTLYLELGRHQFPEKGWNDFVVIVLTWWLSAMREMKLGRSTNQELRFMDGPLHINVSKREFDFCQIECFEDRSDGKAEYSCALRFSVLLNEIIGAAESVYAVCSENGWDSDDVRELGISIGNL